MAEQQQDVDSLKRRGRRRLVGAVALVLLAVIVLPMVLDPAPRTDLPPVSVRIPAEDEGAFKPKGAKPEVPANAPEGPAPTAKPDAAPAAEKGSQTAKSAEPKAVKKPEEKAQFVVPVGAFANPDGVIARLAAAKMPYFTENAPGNLTRVRAGPFATREAAEKAASRLKDLGLQPGAVASRAG